MISLIHISMQGLCTCVILHKGNKTQENLVFLLLFVLFFKITSYTENSAKDAPEHKQSDTVWFTKGTAPLQYNNLCPSSINDEQLLFTVQCGLWNVSLLYLRMPYINHKTILMKAKSSAVSVLWSDNEISKHAVTQTSCMVTECHALWPFLLLTCQRHLWLLQ